MVNEYWNVMDKLIHKRKPFVLSKSYWVVLFSSCHKHKPFLASDEQLMLRCFIQLTSQTQATPVSNFCYDVYLTNTSCFWCHFSTDKTVACVSEGLCVQRLLDVPLIPRIPLNENRPVPDRLWHVCSKTSRSILFKNHEY